MRIELRKFERDDFERLISWIDSPEALHEWAGNIFGFPLNPAQLESYLRDADREHSQRRIFKAVDAADGHVLGHVELSHIWPHLSGRVSRVLVGQKSLRGKGIGTVMVDHLVAFGFEEFSFHRIDLGVLDSNKAAIRCYEKVGFTHVGTWPQAIITSEGAKSVYWMTIFHSDWQRKNI